MSVVTGISRNITGPLAAIATVIAMCVAAPVAAYASVATINGALSNFDTFNDTGVDAHGFEIELEGVNPPEIQYFFGAPYNRYGTPNLVPYNDGVHWGTRVRWESAADAQGNYANRTVPAPSNPTPTNGHECYLYGPAGATQQQYDASGCEHFGIGTYGNPTATTYHWLVDDGTHTGKLTYSGAPVSMPAPVWSVAPGGNVAAALPAPAPAPVAALPGVPVCSLWGDAVWVKVFKTESHKPAQLGALLTDSNEVPEAAAEVETEWEFLQGRPTCDSSGKPLDVQPANEIVHQAAAGAGAESVTRRFEIYKYTGVYDDSDGGNHEALPLCDSNPFKQSCSSAPQAQPNSDLGAYMGAQMAAANLMAAGINVSTMSITKDGDGTGVVSDSGGISCGDLCGGSYSTGTTVTLTATPDAGSHVSAWSIPGCGRQFSCTFTVDQDTTVNVTFASGASIPSPTVASLSATTGAAGTSIVISGSDFDGLQSVDFNGVAATVSAASSTSITAVVPCGAGSGTVHVVTDGGTAASASFTESIAKPVVASFAPTTASPGGTVTVSGSFLGCVTNVTVSGSSAAIVDQGNTQLRFTIPNSAVTGVLSVKNAAGTTTTAAKLTVVPLPTITGVSVGHALPGAKFVVNGSLLKATSSVRINGTTAKYTSAPTAVTVTVPAGASTGPLVLVVAGITLTAPSDFIVDVPAPTVASASPLTGAIGTSILVKGANFTQDSTVTIGSREQRRTVLSPTVMIVTVSAGTATGLLKVATAGGAATVGSFTVAAGSAATTITKVSAKSAMGGAVVTITGTNLGNLSSVKVAGAIAAFTVLTPTTAAVVVPTGARTGYIAGTTAGGSAVSGPAFTVNVGSSVPTVTGASPASAVVGLWLKLTGANLAATTSVVWAGTNVDYYVTAANAIYVHVPQGAATGALVVSTPGGQATTPTIKVT